MKDNIKPEWNYEIPMESFQKLTGAVKKITHHWRFTSEDTSEDWIEFHFEDKSKIRRPKGFGDVFTFNPDHRGLIQYTYKGGLARKRLKEIREFEEKHKKEIAEYERLKLIYGKSTP